MGTINGKFGGQSENKREQEKCERKDEQGVKGEQDRDSGSHYNHSLCMGLSSHRVQSLSFDILECLHKCILEHRKFWDSSQGLQKVGLAQANHKKLLLRNESEAEAIMRSRVQRLTLRN